MTLKEIYDSLDPVPPKTLWIRRVANAAKVSEMTVRMWLSGRQTPLPGIRALVAKELNSTPEELWPNA